MFRVLFAATAAVFLASPGAAGAAEAPLTGADLAACRAVADQPICLLKLAARSRVHHSFRENIAIGYAPAVLAAVGPDPADDPSDPVGVVLRQPYRAAAVKALIADHDGAAPTDALAPIRALPARASSDSADRSKTDQDAAAQRISAYGELWRAGHGDTALPPARRPSPALLRAALAAWRADLPLAGDDADREGLAAAYRDLGDTASADAVAPQTPASEVERLLDAGRYVEAAEALDRVRDQPILDATMAADAKVATFVNAMAGAFQAQSELAIVRRAVDDGHADIGVALAERILDRWLTPSSQPTAKASPAGPEALQIAAYLMLIAEKAPRAQALNWADRFDAAARDRTSPTAAVNAAAAMRAWMKLGEADRLAKLKAFWAKDMSEAAAACRQGTFKSCVKRPAIIIAISLKGRPLGTPWDELAPASGQRSGASSLVGQGRAGIDARLAGLSDPWERLAPLFTCTSDATEARDLPLAAYCAQRLAAEPEPQPKVVLPGLPPLRPERVNSILRVARGAARQNDRKVFTDMVTLAFDLAARDPEEDVGPAPLLEDIAIAELREQGRL